MKPTTQLAETTAPDGAVFTLLKHDGQFFLHMNQRQVMSTTLTLSEILLADVGCGFAQPPEVPRVLIGGLGLGFSLRRALELTGSEAEVVVAEILPEIVRWNREHLEGLNDEILNDPRTVVFEGDVYEVIREAAGKASRFDAILLDVDDGPSSLLQKGNGRIYDKRGLQTLRAALNPGGRVSIWAAAPEPQLEQQLRKAGFRTEEIPCAKHARARRQDHRIYLAERRDR
ncbi:MAG: spermine synthase [Verrucomicrobiota bacterium]